MLKMNNGESDSAKPGSPLQEGIKKHTIYLIFHSTNASIAS